MVGRREAAFHQAIISESVSYPGCSTGRSTVSLKNQRLRCPGRSQAHCRLAQSRIDTDITP